MASKPETRTDTSEPVAVAIVRYPNRRLYDRSRGKYVTLPEITELVRQGKTVTIRDSKSGEDLTRTILTQIILEQHPERMELFPVPVLHLIIQANDIALGFLREYLRQSLAYLEVWQKAAALTPLAGPLEWMKAFLPGEPPAGTFPEAARSPAEVQALMERLAELERRIDEINRPASSRGRKPAR